MPFRDIRIVIDDLHVKALCSSRNCRAYPAQADGSERRSSYSTDHRNAFSDKAIQEVRFQLLLVGTETTHKI
ncbi:hypothetical protein D3C80_1738590 [compost metagenome]